MVLFYKKNGHKPENTKLQAFNKMPQPTSVKGLQCFLGMANNMNKYSPRLAELGDSLRELTKYNAPFIWVSEHTEAFDAIKEQITSAPILCPQQASKCVQMQA